MKLSTKGRYAVVALVDVALHQSAGLVSINEISMRQDISLAYLEQLFAKLRRDGLVNALRGPSGGSKGWYLGIEGTIALKSALGRSERTRLRLLAQNDPSRCDGKQFGTLPCHFRLVGNRRQLVAHRHR